MNPPFTCSRQADSEAVSLESEMAGQEHAYELN